jgi:hypothetical protein
MIAMRDELVRRAEDERERNEWSRAGLRQLLRIPQSQLWEQHKSRLAEVLSADDWYALMKAYKGIDNLRGISASERWFTATGAFTSRELEQIATNLATEIQAGATALSRLAGGGSPWPHQAETDVVRRVLLARATAAPEKIVANEASDRSSTDPSSSPNPSASG